MATVAFHSLDNAEVIDVEFVNLQGQWRLRKLLVDSGFTGSSSVILGNDTTELIRAQIPATQTTGALQGAQNRAWVTCRIPQMADRARAGGAGALGAVGGRHDRHAVRDPGQRRARDRVAIANVFGHGIEASRNGRMV